MSVWLDGRLNRWLTDWLFSPTKLIIGPFDADIDKCTKPPHGCSQLCNNTEGNYNCFCLKGFLLQKDNKTCVGTFWWIKQVFFGSSCSISEQLFEPQVATPISGDFRGGFRLFYLICIATAFNTSWCTLTISLTACGLLRRECLLMTPV